MKRTTLIILFLLIIGVQSGFAQALPPLTEEYTSEDGLLVVHYPADWFVNDDDEAIIFAPSAVEGEVLRSDPLPSGYFAITVIQPHLLSDLGLEATANPDEALETLIDLAAFEGEVEPYNRMGVPGATAMVSNMEVEAGQLVALQFETGTVLAAIEFSSAAEQYSDQMQDYVAYGLGGLVYNGQSAADGSVDVSMIVPAETIETPIASGDPTFQWITARPYGVDPEENFTTINDLAISTDGMLYALDSMMGIWTLDPATGEVVGNLPLNSRLYVPEYMAIDPATGNFYIALNFDSIIFQVSPDGEMLNYFGEAGAGEGQFGEYGPSGIAIYEDRVYVGDSNENEDGEPFARIQIFDLDGNYLSEFDISSVTTSFPVFDIDDNGDIYVSGGFSGITVFDREGNVQSEIEPDGDIYLLPNGMEVVGDTIYMTTYEGIIAINTDGELVGTYGTKVEDPDDGVLPEFGTFFYPEALAVADGVIYFGDYFTNSVSSITALDTTNAATSASAASTPEVEAAATMELTGGAYATGTITDTLTENAFRFTAEAGDVITITMSETSGTLDPLVRLYAAEDYPDGDPIAENDDSGDSELGIFNSRIEDFEIEDSGEYVIVATHFMGEGEYELTLAGDDFYTLELITGVSAVGQTQVEPVGFEIEAGDTIFTLITDEGPEQRFSFVGSAGDLVTISLVADDEDELDPLVRLYMAEDYPDGDPVAENDDSSDMAFGYYSSLIENFALPADGQYVIVATRFSGEGDASVSLEVEAAGESVAQIAGEEIRQWASTATGSSQYGEERWSFLQTTGAPNTDVCGDQPTAWASSSSSGVDYLVLTFEQGVIPSQVNIYQTFNPGSITSIELSHSESGEIFELPNSADAPGNTPCPGVFTVDVSGIDAYVNNVIIYLDQSIGGGWNEIDAVELVGTTEYANSTSDSEAALDAAIASVENGSYADALEQFDSILSDDPENPVALYYRGRAHYFLADYEAALADFNAALDYGFYDAASTYNMRGLIYLELGRYDDALADFDQAIIFSPTYTAPRTNRAYVNAYHLVNWEAYVEEYRELVELVPDNPGYYNNIGWGLIQLERYEEALEPLEQALDMEPNNLNYLDSRGWAYLGLMDYEAAQTDFERAVWLGGTYSYYGLGELYAALGDNELALENLQTYVELEGEDAEQDALDLITQLESTAVSELRQWANFATGSSQFAESGWSFMQATGAPDALTCGDSMQAWASESTGSEILALEFEQAVVPSQVNIYQNLNPGAITHIELTNTDTSAIIEVPDSADPPGNTSCPGVFTVDISGINDPVNGVIIYLDQTIVGDWNEIDAVELVGTPANAASATTEAPTGQPNTGAGDMALTERLDFEGEMAVSYPEGWETDAGGFPLIAPSEDAARALQTGAPLPEGEIAIGILPPSSYAVIGVSPSDSAEAMIAQVAEAFNGSVTAAPLTDLPYTAYSAPLTGTSSLPANTHLITVEYEAGVVTFVIVTDDIETYMPLLADMIASLSLS